MKRLLPLVVIVLAVGWPSAVGAADGSPPLTDLEMPDPYITDGTAARDFQQAREKWLSSGIRNYRMRIFQTCFCAPPRQVDVTVRRGKPVRVSARKWLGPRTVAGVFQTVHQAIKAGVPGLKVKYHPRLGFVKTVWIDHLRMAVDDETGYQIVGFKRLR